MVRLAGQSAMERWQSEATHKGEPHVLTDVQLHRRGNVHYCWWPEGDGPKLYRDFTIIVNECLQQDVTHLTLLAGSKGTGSLRIKLLPDNLTGGA
jgi:hypothetical protein